MVVVAGSVVRQLSDRMQSSSRPLRKHSRLHRHGTKLSKDAIKVSCSSAQSRHSPDAAPPFNMYSGRCAQRSTFRDRRFISLRGTEHVTGRRPRSAPPRAAYWTARVQHVPTCEQMHVGTTLGQAAKALGICQTVCACRRAMPRLCYSQWCIAATPAQAYCQSGVRLAAGQILDRFTTVARNRFSAGLGRTSAAAHQPAARSDTRGLRLCM